MCDMQTESPSLTRRVLNWVRSVCPLWQARKPVETTVGTSVVIFEVIDVADFKYPLAVWPMPMAGGSWRFVMENYPDHKLVDVHVTPSTVYIYIERKK